MIRRDDYLIAVLEELQNDIFIMDEEEIYDVLQHVIEMLAEDEAINEEYLYD